jgi:hypothetical protein
MNIKLAILFVKQLFINIIFVYHHYVGSPLEGLDNLSSLVDFKYSGTFDSLHCLIRDDSDHEVLSCDSVTLSDGINVASMH